MTHLFLLHIMKLRLSIILKFLPTLECHIISTTKLISYGTLSVNPYECI